MNVTSFFLVGSSVLMFGCDPKTTSGTTEQMVSTGETTGTTTGTSSTDSSTGEPTTTTETTTGNPSTGSSTEDPTEPDTDPFIPDVDVPNVEPECDYHLEGCDEGQKCNVYTPEGETNILSYLGCFPLDPEPKQIGEPCNTGELPHDGIDNCAEASFCWNLDDEGNGTCYGLCYVLPGNENYEFVCPDQAASCQVCQECNVGLCSPFCDPLIDDCNENEVCVPQNDGFGCVFDAGNGEGVDGAPCEFVNICNPGLMCADGNSVVGCETNGCCTPFCDLGDPEACPEVEEDCVQVYDPQPEGYEHVGICVIPE